MVIDNSPVRSGATSNAYGEPPMTNDMTTLRTLIEKKSDADILREMIGFTVERLMGWKFLLSQAQLLESARRIASCSATAIAIASGRRALVQSNCVSRSCASAATSTAFSDRVGWPRKR